MPKQYLMQMVEPNGGRLMLYVDGLMERLEVFPKAGHPRVVIKRPDKGVEWWLSPHANTYSQAKLLPRSEEPMELERLLRDAYGLDMLLDWSEDGVETIDGHTCRRFVGRYRIEGHGSTAEADTVCLVDAKTGLRRRENSYDAKGALMTTKDYSFGSPAPSLFELPEGFQRVDHDKRRAGG